MNKKIIAITLTILSIITLLTGCGSDWITGNEWLLKQEDCFDDLEAFADGMDEVYTLYFIESISTEDFATELQLLSQQHKVLSAFYEQMKTENPIEPETHSFLSKKGTEAIENIYTCLGDIISSSVDENGTPLPQDQLAYQYLAFRQTLTGYIIEYITAVAWYKDSIRIL